MSVLAGSIDAHLPPVDRSGRQPATVPRERGSAPPAGRRKANGETVMIPCSMPGTQVMNQMICMASSAGKSPGPSRPPPRAGMRHSARSNPPVSASSEEYADQPQSERVEK